MKKVSEDREDREDGLKQRFYKNTLISTGIQFLMEKGVQKHLDEGNLKKLAIGARVVLRLMRF